MKHSDLIGTLIFTMGLIACPNLSIAMSVETELLLIDESVLNGRVIPAISDFLEHGDPAAAKQLVQEAVSGQQFQETLKSDVSSDRVIAQFFARGSEELLEGRLPKEILDDRGELIKDQKAIQRHQTDRILSRFPVLFLCSWSRDGSQTHVTLSRGQLTKYLRSQSSWLDEMLGSSNELLGKALDMRLSIGGEAKLLTKEEAAILLSKVEEVPAPSQNQKLIKEYEILKQLLQIAAADPRFRILILTM